MEGSFIWCSFLRLAAAFVNVLCNCDLQRHGDDFFSVMAGIDPEGQCHPGSVTVGQDKRENTFYTL